MSGEMRLVRGALIWGSAAALPVAGIAYLVRGWPGAVSVLLALTIVLGNAGLAAGLSALAGRVSTMSAAFVSIPSFAARMLCILTALAALRGRSFIDDPTFALTFSVGVTAVLIAEARTWKRTPWLAMTLNNAKTLNKENS